MENTEDRALTPQGQEAETKERLPAVAIIGRPNVGKSSLFNLIVGRRLSIVHSESGVTRDRVIATTRRHGKTFELIDTGGLGMNLKGRRKTLEPGKNAENRTLYFAELIREQVKTALESADILVVVADAAAGVTPQDAEVAEAARRSGKPTLMVANKVDNARMETDASLFSELGFPRVFPLSCLHRVGFDDLMDAIIELLPDTPVAVPEERLAITVAGRPNVGKSSLINKMIGEDRLMVSEVAGTTRDAIDAPFDLKLEDETIPATLVDTAGLRKRGKADSAVEIFSVMRAETAIKRSAVVTLVLDANERGATAQDARIGRAIVDAGKGCVIAVNKWDALKGVSPKELEKEILRDLPFLDYAPIVPVCALSGYNLKALTQAIGLVARQRQVKIPTSAINRVLADAMARRSPPAISQRFFKVYYATMVSCDPPSFVMFVNDPDLCPPSYQVYLARSLRRAFGLPGLPIRLELRPRERE